MGSQETTIKIWVYEKCKINEVAERNDMLVQEVIELLVENYLDDLCDQYDLK